MKLFQLFESRELNAELIWYQRYITDHDLSIQMEIENDKLAFRIKNTLHRWPLAVATRVRTQVLIDAEKSFFYARDSGGRFELGEPVIATNAKVSNWYAVTILRKRFKLGEPAISKEPESSFLYAREVIKGQFKLGEPAISTDAEQSYRYAVLINDRFKLGEPAISKDARYSQQYQAFLKTLP